MGFFSTTKKVASHMFDVRVDKWFGWESISATTNDYRNVIREMATPEKATYSETFEEALKRLGLTQADVDQRTIEFSRLFYFFIALFIGIIIYGLVMAFEGFMVAALVSFCVSIYTLTQAFRFHFWLFQIKNRKLGCTLKEWMEGKTFDQFKSPPPPDVPSLPPENPGT